MLESILWSDDIHKMFQDAEREKHTSLLNVV